LQLGAAQLGVVDGLERLGLENRGFLLGVDGGLVAGLLEDRRSFLPGLNSQVTGFVQRLGGFGSLLGVGVLCLFLQVIPETHRGHAPLCKGRSAGTAERVRAV